MHNKKVSIENKKFSIENKKLVKQLVVNDLHRTTSGGNS
jgi:hypothetical protein